MPKITVNDLDINYKVQGMGDPLLMIMGLSFSLVDWGTELPNLLSQHYKVILFDNRDAGETSRSTKKYTVADMANDAVGLLDALGEPKAHVFGISMGGMIAQHIALSYPDRVDKLILGGTMAGGTCSKFSPFSDLLSTNNLELFFTPEFIQTNQASLAQFFQVSVLYHSTGDALARQLYAINTHDTCDRLSDITAPTLVITGDSDRAIPPGNSTVLAEKIPNAQLEIIDNAGHAFCFSHPQQTAVTLINFLKHDR